MYNKSRFLGMVFILIALALIFFSNSAKAASGAWMAIVLDLSLRGGLTMYRFRQGGWMQAKV